MTLNPQQKMLHEKAKDTASRFRWAESDLIDILQKIEEKRVFRALGYASLFQYGLKELKLSEANVSNFIAVARKSREIPEIKTEIKNGNITVSKARKIVPVIKKENAPQWLEMAKTLPQKKLEKAVAKEVPREATPEKAKYVSETRIDLRLGVEEKLLKKLRRIQDLLSQRKRRPVSLEEVLDEMSDDYILRHDPVKKAQRVLNKNNQKNKSVKTACLKTREVGTKPSKRFAIPAKIIHQIQDRDQGQCSYIHSNGKRCENQKFLEMHHILPVSQGGANQVKNLQLLCFSHHRGVHGG